MAYNRKNLLKRIIDIQNIYLEHSPKGVTDKYIYEELIYPNYKISRSCFYNYLAINAKKELKDIENAEQQQLKLFA